MAAITSSATGCERTISMVRKVILKVKMEGKEIDPHRKQNAKPPIKSITSRRGLLEILEDSSY